MCVNKFIENLQKILNMLMFGDIVLSIRPKDVDYNMFFVIMQILFKITFILFCIILFYFLKIIIIFFLFFVEYEDVI